jgi:hypothetical protein
MYFYSGVYSQKNPSICNTITLKLTIKYSKINFQTQRRRRKVQSTAC